MLDQTKRDWLNAFMENGINDMKLINYAFSRLLSSGKPFMPTVAEFIGWCKEGNVPEGTKGCLESYNEILGYMALPLESRKLSGLNPEVYHTLHNLDDFYQWRHAHKKKSREMWYAEHNKTLDVLRNGDGLVESPVDRIKLNNKRTPVPKEEAIRRIQEMRASLKKPRGIKDDT